MYVSQPKTRHNEQRSNVFLVGSRAMLAKKRTFTPDKTLQANVRGKGGGGGVYYANGHESVNGFRPPLAEMPRVPERSPMRE